MSTKKKLNLKSSKVQLLFSNWLAQVVALLKPKFLYLILGRGAGKTTDFQTERIMDMVYDLPGAPVALVSDTYMNLTKNVLPSLIEGLERKGWVEGTHYVIEKAPPEVSEEMLKKVPKELREHFWKPYNRIISYKHTIIFFTGYNFTLVSLDRPSAAAGRSYVHIIGDEVKFFPEHKIAKLTKAVRGYWVKYGQSVYYGGHTFTTDMPNINNVGEYDWILKQAKKMKKSIIMRILTVALVLNEVIQELILAKESGDKKDMVNKEKLYDRWNERYIKVRKKSTFFYIASSYVNADILRPEYFEGEFESDLEDVHTAILSSKPKLEKGNRFYTALNSSHFYTNGNSRYWSEQFGIRDTEDCRILTYLETDKILEAGVDFGNQMSMVLGQEQNNGKRYRVLKTIHTLSPQWIRELADSFIEYFEPHKHKVLHMYYDRAGNNLKAAKQDLAGKLKKAIEYDKNSKKTGWKVVLMSEGQGNIFSWDEYDFMIDLMNGNNRKLPQLMIDQYNCKPLKSSMEKAPTKIKTYKGKKRIVKDKKSEGLPIHRLPMESTNFSDAFKYLMCRKNYMKYTRAKQNRGLLDVG